MKDLTREMIAAARRATEECVARGYSRSDQVTRDSAWRAAQEVRLAAESGVAADPPDPWRDRTDLD